MIECDALRLIDEYIKSSSSYTTTTSTRSNSPNPTQFRLSQLSSSSCKNTPNNEDLYLLKKKSHYPYMSDDSGVRSNETTAFSPPTSSSMSTSNVGPNPTELGKSESINKTTSIALDEELTRKNPNRPYSYYAATNLNPLDFAELFKDLEQPKNSDEKTLSQNNNNSSRTIASKKKRSLFKNKSNNVLSLSLSDFKASNLSLSKTKQAPLGMRTNPLPRKNKNSTKAFSYCDRDRDSKIEINNEENFLNEKQPESNKNTKGQNRRSMALRFNRFIRNIFRSASKTKVTEVKGNVALEVNEKVNSGILKGKNALYGDADDNDEVFENNQPNSEKNTNANNRYSNLTENLRFSKLFGSFRKIATSTNSKEETSLSLSTSSITSNSNSLKLSTKNRRSKKYKYNLASQTATRLSTATTVTSSHQTSASTNLRKSSRSQKGGRKSISMYASANEESYSTPLFTDHRQKWMRNVLERLLVTNENHAQNHHHHSSLPSPLADVPATFSSSSSSSPVDILQDGFIPTELSPLSTVVNEARLSMKRISSSYDSPVIVKGKPQSFDVIDFEAIKNRFYSDIVQKIKEISEKYLKIINENSNISTASTLFDLTPHSYFQSETDEIRFDHDSFASIPFIDEDSSSLISFHEVKNKQETTENFINLHDLIENLNCENFEKILTKLLLKNQYADSTWFKITFVFEFVHKAVQFVLNSVYSNNKDALIFSLKEYGANFIHTKYCDWVYEQGGWISLKKVQVPFLVENQVKDNERIH